MPNEIDLGLQMPSERCPRAAPLPPTKLRLGHHSSSPSRPLLPQDQQHQCSPWSFPAWQQGWNSQIQFTSTRETAHYTVQSPLCGQNFSMMISSKRNMPHGVKLVVPSLLGTYVVWRQVVFTHVNMWLPCAFPVHKLEMQPEIPFG